MITRLEVAHLIVAERPVRIRCQCLICRQIGQVRFSTLLSTTGLFHSTREKAVNASHYRVLREAPSGGDREFVDHETGSKSDRAELGRLG
jgi:hypothetical protein